MANVSITNLPPVLTINGTEIIPAVQLQGSNPASYVTVGLTTEQIVSLATGGGGISLLAVAAGGTGVSTFSVANGILLGNGTSALTQIAAPAGTNYVLVGSAGGTYSWQPTIPVTAGVNSVSFGTTGLTPSSAHAGAITVAGTLVAANGGTGQSAYSVGDILYASTTTALSKLSDVAVGSVLASGGVGVAPGYTSSPSLSGTVTAAAYIANETITGSLNQGAFSYGTLNYSDVNIFASFQSTANGYAQIVLGNSSNLGAASTDFIVGNDKTTATTYYGDFGMNSSGWTGTLGTNSLNAPSVVYLSSTSSDLVIGTTTSNYVRFVTSGGADALTISPSGVVTIPNADIIQTSLTTPIVYGGSTSSSSLTLESTSATSGTFSDSILFKVGNAGSPTTAVSIASSGLVTIPTISVTPTASAPSAATGTVWYDSTKDSLSYYNATGYEINIGQQVDQICYNNTGSSIPAGTAVYLSGGSNGNAPYISPAIATSVGNANMVGVTGQTIANGSTGIVVILGEVFNYNTTGWTAGQTLYLSSSTAGALTTTQPTSPFYAVRAGFVIVGGSSTNGIIFASVRNVYTLGSNIISPVTFTAFSTSSVPLVVNGLSGQFTDLIQVNTYSGGTKAFSVGNTGTVSAPVLSYTTATGATSETVPLVIGGTAASSTLTLQSTSGVGTSDSIVFKTGNNGAVTALSISTAGVVTATTPTAGTNTTQLATTAFVTSQGLGFTGFRNRIINGNMAIDQRNSGTSQTITAGAALAYIVDRWYAYCTGANVTGQRVANTGTTGSPSQYVYQFTGAAGVTGIGCAQRIEAANIYDLAGSTATLSVNIANSLLTTVTWTAYYANTTDTFGTLASPTKTQIATGTFTVSSTMTRYSTNISVPNAATTGIEVLFTVNAQTSGTWQVGNIEFELGSIATPFERRINQVELAMCQRYYLSAINSFVTPGGGTNTSYQFKVTMRTTPSLTVTPSSGTITYNTSSPDGFVLSNTAQATCSVVASAEL